MKMYVLVRKDLEPTYRCVQGAHALAQYATDYPEEFSRWNNSTLVFLGVRYPREILSWADFLEEKGYEFVIYREPDQQGEATALACYNTGEVFRKLNTA